MVLVAPSIGELERRCSRFFAADTKRMVDFRRHIVDELQLIGKVYVIGGAIRDLAFFGAEERPISDFDIVVAGDARRVASFARSINAIPNRFGGYGFKGAGMKVDFWALSRTWARVESHVRISRPHHLVHSTFFDWDGIIFEFEGGKINALPKYLDRLRGRVLDINLLATPSVHGNLVRALRRLVMFDSRPGFRLRIFMKENLGNYDWESVVEAERNAFSVLYLDQYKSTLDFVQRFLANRSRSVPGVDDRRQMEFNF